MQLPLLLLLFQVWSNVKFSSSQTVCPNLPDVPHASVTENTKKDEYRQGDIIHFTCETGYISGPTIKYICSSENWVALNRVKCYLKPCQLPDDTPNGYYQLTRGSDFVFGTIIKYFCNEGYQMASRQDTRTCLLDKWTNHVPICEPFSCSLPPADGEITVTGLPDNDEPILPDRFLTFSCDVPGKYLNGNKMLVCGKDGNWSNPFPTCEDFTCNVDSMSPNLSAFSGLSPANKTVKVGHNLKFQCNEGYTLNGPAEIQCLGTGQWSANFPTCTEKCRITEISPTVHIHPQTASGTLLQAGQKRTFTCTIRSHSLWGKGEVTCLPSGQWSSPFPTCGVPQDCRRPTAPPDAELKHVPKDTYKHNEKAEFVCPNFYTMEGGPSKRCQNGEWVGEMRCMRPCTVNAEDRNRRNIRFKYSRDNKMYSTHDDEIEFSCTRGRPVGGVAMRQRCRDGEMNLPTCQ